MTEAVPPFELFGPEHWIAVLGTIGLAVGLPFLARRFGPGRRERLRIALALSLAAYLVIAPSIRAGIYALPLREHLPLHLCGVSVVLGALMLWLRSYRLYEVVYFWATGGTLAALLTPDIAAGFPHPLFLLFFIGHGFALIAVAFATIVCGFRPRRRSVAIAVGATALYALAIYPVNLFLGSNYLYLTRKPDQASPIDFLGPWPWYILGLAAIVIVMCVLCYLPFEIAARLDRRTAPR